MNSDEYKNLYYKNIFFYNQAVKNSCKTTAKIYARNIQYYGSLAKQPERVPRVVDSSVEEVANNNQQGEKQMTLDAAVQEVKEIEELFNEAKRRKEALSPHLKELREQYGSSFTHDGESYQIRARGGTFYMTHMKKKPGRKKGNQAPKTQPVEVESSTEPQESSLEDSNEHTAEPSEQNFVENSTDFSGWGEQAHASSLDEEVEYLD